MRKPGQTFSKESLRVRQVLSFLGLGVRRYWRTDVSFEGDRTTDSSLFSAFSFQEYCQNLF